jgi:ribonuclease D
MTEAEATEEELPQATLLSPVVVVETAADLRRALDDLLGGSGPLAVDAERASGFRYSQRAYLVQVHRTGSANYLIDPLGVGSLADITNELVDQEWIIHAAHQDLSCLREVGVDPQNLFDTELGARLAGLPRVGLQGVVEDVLGLKLAKEHSAADWSTRPLPESWLTYAALDVELLPRVRDEIHRILTEQGKWDLAHEEFQAQLWPTTPTARPEPWRRLSGLHQIRGSRNLAIARELWLAREEHAIAVDTAPGRLIPDRSLVAAVLANPGSKQELAKLKAFHGRASRSELDRWWDALQRGNLTQDMPEARTPSTGPPPPKMWAEKNPPAWARLAAARDAVKELGDEHEIPAENLLTPDFLRRLCWEPPTPATPESVSAYLLERGARPWQVTLVSEALSQAFVDADQSPPREEAAAS